jgi:cell division protein ZapA
MAEVTLSVGGYSYQLACRDGEEAHLTRLGELVDAKANEARAAVGNASEARQLLLSALLFADEIIEAKSGATSPSAPKAADDNADALEAMAARVEAIAARLESLHQNA